MATAATGNAQKSQLLRLIECPSCLDPFDGSIILCRNGHSVCGICRRSVHNCPVCRVSFTTIRNFTLESLVEHMELPCKYGQQGCEEFMQRSVKEVHELNCRFRTFKCRMTTAQGQPCAWENPASLLLEHTLKEHAGCAWMQENNKDRWKPDDPLREVQLIQAHGELFYLTRQVQNDNMYWALMYIGADNNAQTYSLAVEFPADGCSRRTVKITDICHKFNVSTKKLVDEGMCLGMPNKVIQSFKTDVRGVWYKVQVAIEQPTSFDENTTDIDHTLSG